MARREAEDDDFTPEQRAALLQMLEDHKRARWFWSTFAIYSKATATWITAVAAALAALKLGVWDQLKALLR